MTQDHQDSEKPGFFASRANWVLVGFMAVAGYFLVSEHWAHLVPVLPWLLLLSCPLMHLFMHHGHGGHSGGNDKAAPADRPTSPRNTH